MSEAPVPDLTTTDQTTTDQTTTDQSEVVIEALSREDGLNSTVTVYRDRIEWVKQESISSLPRAKDDPPVIQINTIESVRAKKDGPLFSKVLLRTARQTIVFRMISPEAVQVRDAIHALLTEPGASAPRPPA